MSGLEANHGDVLMTTTQRMRRDKSMSLGGANDGRHRQVTIDFNNRSTVTLTVGAVIAFLGIVSSGVWFVAMQFRDMSEALQANTKAVQSLSAIVWTIQDQSDYAHKLTRANPTMIVPDPKEVVRERIKP